MKNKLFVAALGIAVLAVTPSAFAQKKSGAEVSLIGIKLYDPGLKVVSMYGTPDQVQAVGGSGGAIGPGGPGGGGGPAGAAGGGGGGGGSPTLPPPPLGIIGDPLGPAGFMQKGMAAPPGGDGGAAGLAPAPGGLGPGGGGNIPGAGGGGGVGNGGTGGRILYTRWVYNRNGCKYGFVLDKSNRVVQIEAIGLTNKKVRTARGIGFGSTFAQLIKKYNAPDGYEINGDNVVVRFLVRNKVAFKLSRLGPDKPQVVTGIVVAAGKT